MLFNPGRHLFLHTLICFPFSGEVCYTDYTIPNVALGKPTYSSSEVVASSTSVDGLELYYSHYKLIC